MNQIGIIVNTILADDANVGAVIANRIYPAPAPQDVTLPFATYEVISNEPHDTKDGVSTTDKFRVQVNSWAKNASDAANISGVIRTALDRYTPGLVGGVNLDGIRYETERTDYDDKTDTRMKSQDFFIRIKY